MARHGTLGTVGRSGGPRAVATAWLAVVAVLFLNSSAAAPAGASADSEESRFLALVNQERASRGLGRLLPASDLVTVARRHSARMASRDEVFHNSNLSSEVEGWDLLGENVGVGPSEQEIHDALMASKIHRDVILGPRFTQLGVGVVLEGGEIWLTQVFRLPEAQPQASPDPTGRAEAPAEPTSPPATAAPAYTAPASSPQTAQSPAEPVVAGGASLTAISVPLPEPEDIPVAGIVATGLLLAVVGSASVATRRLFQAL